MSTTRIAASWTLDELIAKLRTDDEHQEGFSTVVEWAEHFGLSEQGMRRLMKEAKAAGAVEIGRDKRERLDGCMTPVPVYRFLLEDGEET